MNIDSKNIIQEQYGYYPLFVDLHGKKIVVIGGGRVAERKVSALLEAGGDVLIISPEVTKTIHTFAENDLITLRARKFQPGDLEGAWLAISATDDTDIQKQVVAEAGQRRIFCNVVDIPEKCSFIVPSMVRRKDLCIAISTAGRSPALAKRIRKEMEETYPVIWGTYLTLLGRLRELILLSSSDSDEKKRLCSVLAQADILKWLEDDDWESIQTWAESVCGRAAEAAVEDVRSNA